MPFLSGLAVVFVGVVGGGDARKVDSQVKAVLAESHVDAASLPQATVRTLAHHGEGSREIVAKLHVDGVIGGELITDGGHSTLRLVIYRADGGLKSLSEVPLGGRSLSKDELAVLRSNFADEVSALAPREEAPLPRTRTPVAAPAAPVTPVARTVASPRGRRAQLADVSFDDPAPAPVAAPAPAPAPARIATRPPAPAAPARAPAAAPRTPEPEIEMEAPPEHVAEPTETADMSDSVRPEDLEAMAIGGGDAAPSLANDSVLHLRASLGLGLTGRSFTPGPSAVAGYASSAVGTVRLAAQADPTPRTTVGVVFEQTLQMSTPMTAGMAPTTMSRWEAIASYTLVRGSIDFAPLAGVGRRAFSIDSSDPARSPDGDYNYLVLGAGASAALGSRLTLRGIMAFEPVVSGVEPTEMAFGEATRWAFDVGASVEARPLAHVFVRAAADYQRFSWSWDKAGARGAGGAVDGYPSGTLSLGAEY